MSLVDRFTVSLDTELLAAFDRHIAGHGYENRSEAIRDLIRDLLLSTRDGDSDEPSVGLLTIVCDHGVGETGGRVRTELAAADPVATGMLMTFVDQSRDVLSVALRGPSGELHALADRIQAIRGVSHGHLLMQPIDPR